MKKTLTLDRVIAAVLTILFLGFIGFALGNMLVQSGSDILESVRYHKIISYLPEDGGNALDRLNGRIQSFTAEISEDVYLKDELGYVNSAFQYALGKRMITTGGQNMVKLTTGHLYDLMEYKSMDEAAQEIIDLKATLPKEATFTFVYEHPTLYDEAQMPEGYEALDHSAEMADEVTTLLREGGIEVIDSRDVLPNSGYALEDLLMYTDQHWATLSAIVMAQTIAERLGLDATKLDVSNMNTLVHEKLFLGRYGQRVGTGLIDPDDIVEYWPKYETTITRHTQRTKSVVDITGDFRTAVVQQDRFEPLEGKTYSIDAYSDYGLTEPYDIFTNTDAPDVTVMLFKDSFAAPIGAFLSLTAQHVISVDLRKTDRSVADWVEEYKPDHIVMAYSLQMLRDDEYAFEG